MCVNGTVFHAAQETQRGRGNKGETCPALLAHYFPINVNPFDGRKNYELMNHAAGHLLMPYKGDFLSTMGEDVLALQSYRPDNKTSS